MNRRIKIFAALLIAVTAYGCSGRPSSVATPDTKPSGADAVTAKAIEKTASSGASQPAPPTKSGPAGGAPSGAETASPSSSSPRVPATTVRASEPNAKPAESPASSVNSQQATPVEPKPREPERRFPAKLVETFAELDQYADGRQSRRTMIKLMSDGARIKDGSYQQWYQDGTRQSLGHYSDDVRIGDWSQWYPNGQLCRVEHYREGKLDGAWSEYRNDGNLEQTVKYVNNLREGQWLTFPPGTKPPKNDEPLPKPIRVEHYVAGKLNGPVTSFYFPSFAKRSEVEYKDGLQEGYEIFWHENGNKAKETLFLHGEPQTASLYWDTDGKKVVKNIFAE